MRRKRPRHAATKRAKANRAQESKKVPRTADGVGAEIKTLEARIAKECGGETIKKRSAETSQSPREAQVGTGDVPFSSLPLSSRTQNALAEAEFVKMTPIQRRAIPHGLAGRDILGEAETGSGKTLAFVVPTIEKLYRSRWTAFDGLGALILSPTRELATQIFDVLVKVSSKHHIACGCVTGGNPVEKEEPYLSSAMCLVATPGRLNQYLDSTPDFDVSNLAVLVVDEADRLVDMGFAPAVKLIISQLPPPRSRCNWLFSATLSKTVLQLLEVVPLHNPVRVTVAPSGSSSTTPENLRQFYSVVPFEKKLDLLHAFLNSHAAKKTIVFVASCKQVRFLGAVFRKIKPGAPIIELHGKMSTLARTSAVKKFAEKTTAILICTDIAARGIDFPKVEWVVQMDCPDSVDTYVHRVGRTARYHASGNSLLILSPLEAPMAKKIEEETKSEVTKHPMKAPFSLKPRLQSILASDIELKMTAQKAFASYMRSLYLMPDKELFDVRRVPVVDLSQSMGLLVPPEVNFIGGAHSGQETDNAAGEGESGSLGFFANNEMKKRKNMSKLQILKEKIKEKKREAASKIERVSVDGQGVEEEAARGSVSMNSAVASDSDEEILQTVRESQAVAVCNESEIEKRALASATSLKALRKQKVKIKKDGTAVVKGLGTLTGRVQAGSHIEFNDSDDDASSHPGEGLVPTDPHASGKNVIRERRGDFVSVVRELEIADEEGSSSSSSSDEEEDMEKAKASAKAGGADEGWNVDGERAAHLKQLKKKLSKVAEEDKLRERQRVRQKHLKLRAKLKGEKETPFQETIVELAGASSGGESSSAEEDEQPSEQEEGPTVAESSFNAPKAAKRRRVDDGGEADLSREELEQIALRKLGIGF